VQREVRALAAEVMQTLRYFSINTTPLVAHMPQSLSAGVGVWRAGQHGYESQEVSLEQEVRLGDSAWSGEGTLPGEVYLGIDPDIGIPHEPDYERVVPGE
jgi:hypothetical protein